MKILYNSIAPGLLKFHFQKTCTGIVCKRMAKSYYEPVKDFEKCDPCHPNCWLVVQIDGKNFHKFSDLHKFEKPNDTSALQLMTKAAEKVMETLHDIVIAYGQSDEYSFVFKKSTSIYNRQASKLSSVVVSQFSSAYAFYWKDFFPNRELHYPPAFDSHLFVHPSNEDLRHYLSTRQDDCHFNNLYNTCFWRLVKSGLTPLAAQEKLKDTRPSDKNEILFSRFEVNYNNESQLYRKGTILFRDKKISNEESESTGTCNGNVDESKKTKLATSTSLLNVDIIRNKFWDDHPYILDS